MNKSPSKDRVPTSRRPRLDILFLKVALKNGLLTEDQCESLVRRQAMLGKDGKRVPMARICLDEGVLDEAQVAKILRGERYMELRAADKHLAHVYGLMGIVDEARLAECLAEQKRLFREAAQGDFPRLNDLLARKGYVAPKQMDEALRLHEMTRDPSRRFSVKDVLSSLKGMKKPADSSRFLTEVLEEFGIDRKAAEERYGDEIEIYVECPKCGRSILKSSTECPGCRASLGD